MEQIQDLWVEVILKMRLQGNREKERKSITWLASPRCKCGFVARALSTTKKIKLMISILKVIASRSRDFATRLKQYCMSAKGCSSLIFYGS
jgi:hypothetical protein